GLERCITVTLGELHKLGFIHRDIQASNIILNIKGRPQLVDFGFACKINPNRPRAYSFCGTLHSMAPEVAALGVGAPSRGPPGGPQGSTNTGAPQGGPPQGAPSASSAAGGCPGGPSGGPPLGAPEAEGAAEGYLGAPVDCTAPFGYRDYEKDP
ncbi:hypothetical protein EMWEY_00059380, partial [Eimeria maxima]